MIRVVGMTKDNEVIEQKGFENLNTNHFEWYWVDFNEPTDSETAKLGTYFYFHPLAIEDCYNTVQRPKLNYYDDVVFFITHSINKSGYEKREVDFFIGENYIVSYHKDSLEEVDNVWERVLSQQQNREWDEYSVLYEIMDKLVDNYFPILYEIEERLNNIDENPQHEPMKLLMERLFDTRSDLLLIRQTIYPMRDLLYRMLNTTHLPGIKEKKEYFSDIHDHLLKLADMVQSNSEMTADIRDSNLSLNSYQQNQTMMVLTIMTVIFSPLTFIAGIYGMNFNYMPELTWKYSYFVVIGVMVLISVFLIFWFKKKGWFNL